MQEAKDWDAAELNRRILLTEAEAARSIGFTERFLQNRRHRGDGPPFVRVSARAVRYRPQDLEQWAEKRLCRSTSDTGAPEAA
jgi:predicted DNA-binding transcriptional regulator AlpA